MIELGQCSQVIEPNDDVTLQFRWVGEDDLRGVGTVLWSFTMHQLDGERIVQLGYKLVKDGSSSQFSFDHTSADSDQPAQINYVENVRRIGDKQIDVTFPVEAYRNIKQPYWKQWVVNVNGNDVAERTVDKLV